jgi:hypothetical protein
MCLLVLFVAYSFHVRHLPFMSTSERTAIVAKYRDKRVANKPKIAEV